MHTTEVNVNKLGLRQLTGWLGTDSVPTRYLTTKPGNNCDWQPIIKASYPNQTKTAIHSIKASLSLLMNNNFLTH